MSFTPQEASLREEEERRELQAVLQSGIFSKAPNLQRFLEYVAEKYFAGESDEVKEYSVAVQALSRPESFDPQSDTIVRVTAHALRKRLELYYTHEGANHAIQIQLPSGRYILRFLRKQDAALPELINTAGIAASLAAANHTADAATASGSTADAGSISKLAKHPRLNNQLVTWLGWAAFGVVMLALLIAFAFHQRKHLHAVRLVKLRESSPGFAAGRDASIRLLFGEPRLPYIDAAGQPWSVESFCKGGTTYSHPNQNVQGTDDPTIYREGRQGKFDCKIPVPVGTYQLTLLFAETSGGKEATKQVDYAINEGPTQAIDVVDEAGGNGLATAKVYAGVRPSADGTVHLDFTSNDAFVNAAVLTPTPDNNPLPLRMLAGPAVFHDDQGNIWQPEQFFIGGRRTYNPDNLPKVPNAKLFEWERYGHFRYQLPVVPGIKYSVTLYFSESWFGNGNGGNGGVGSRVFDVYCNGTVLLDHFDILKAQQTGTAIVTIPHVKPTAHGMLDLSFAPVTNYPLVNAIEVDPEEN